MNIEEFKERLFNKLVAIREIEEGDKERFLEDAEEFVPQLTLFLEIANDAVIDALGSGEEAPAPSIEKDSVVDA